MIDVNLTARQLVAGEPVVGEITGHGSRHDVVLTPVADALRDWSRDFVLVSLPNSRTCWPFDLLSGSGYHHWSYVAEKLGLLDVDAKLIADLLQGVVNAVIEHDQAA